MTGTKTPSAGSTCPRPVGFVLPRDEDAARALQALSRRHRRDADKLIAALPDAGPDERAWRALLLGYQARERRDFTAAAEAWLASAALALEWALRRESLGNAKMPHATIASRGLLPFTRSVKGQPARICEGPADPEALRLAARALHELGWIRRRQDVPREALRIQRAAYKLRVTHGSFVEMWETAADLGLDAELAGQTRVAQQWFQAATEHGAFALEEPDRLQAIAWTHLSRSLTTRGRHTEAVAAARKARAHWEAHDPGAATVALADLRLGHALLRQAQALLETHDDDARLTLDTALNTLDAAYEALLAFGRRYAGDIHWCAEQRDFAQRLRAAPAV